MNTPQERYRQYLESLTSETLTELGNFVAPDVHFKDPFNDARGIEAMRRVFRHMFENISAIRFTVSHMAMDGDVCIMSWQFEGQLQNRAWSFDGTSIVTFAANGRVVAHIDHWDAGRNFYERLPVIGRLIAWLREKVAVH